jgi:hypothetical protein
MTRHTYDVTVVFIKDKEQKEFVFTVASQDEQNAKRRAIADCKRRFSSAKQIEATDVSERTLRKDY